LLNWATIGVGTISLEIYLVHTQFYVHDAGLNWPFPVSVLVFATYSLIGSLFVYWVAAQIRSAFNRG
jgi:hypothetical protein